MKTEKQYKEIYDRYLELIDENLKLNYRNEQKILAFKTIQVMMDDILKPEDNSVLREFEDVREVVTYLKALIDIQVDFNDNNDM